MYLEENLKLIKDSQLDIEILKRENEKLCRENNTKIEGLQDIIKSTEETLEADLRESGQKKLECKLGWCAFRVMPDSWEYDLTKLFRWAKEDDVRADRYIKVVEEFRKAELKKDIAEGLLTYDDIVDFGLTIKKQEPKFNYKLNGGVL
jgi:hypothetical protein